MERISRIQYGGQDANKVGEVAVVTRCLSTRAQRVNWDAVDRLIVVSDAKYREFVAAFPEQAPKTVVIPEADLPYCDWMGSLNVQEWRSTFRFPTYRLLTLTPNSRLVSTSSRRNRYHRR